MSKLWHISDLYGTISEAEPFSYSFDSWVEFLISKTWKANWISGCKPVHWNWCDVQSEEYKNCYDAEICEDSDFLDLVWLSMAPCNVRHVRVSAKKEEEADVRKWLIKHHFLQGEDV